MRRVRFPLLGSILCLVALLEASSLAVAAELETDPSHYRNHLSSLKPGDTLNLTPGRYPRLVIAGLNGTSTAWITIKGPASGAPAVVTGESGYNTIEITNSSFVAIENLRINSLGIEGAFGISAKGGVANHTHDIRIEGNILVGQNAEQQTVGISTKTPTWGWIIRSNQISGAGTGIYLGNSDGTQPFVDGVIEDNLIQDTIGYNMEIKDQISIPVIPGMPTVPTSTIIRNNVFIKDDQSSPDGDRPNLLVGAFPINGTGSRNLYEIYGNLFVHNHREALFQGSGRISLHDNIFVDGPPDYAAVVLRQQNFPLRTAYVYNNTVYTSGQGIHFGTAALDADAVIGNLVFAATPITGTVGRSSDNVIAPLAIAGTYVNSPSFELGAMDFYPRPGKCQGKAIDLRPFRTNVDYNRDFNNTPKAHLNGAVVFRGAYAGEGRNPGWRLQATIKPSTGSFSPTREGEGRSSDSVNRDVNPFFPILAERFNDVEVANTTGTRGEDIFAVGRNCEPVRWLDGCASRPGNRDSAGLLLWESFARAQQPTTQRCNCSSFTRAIG